MSLCSIPSTSPSENVLVNYEIRWNQSLMRLAPKSSLVIKCWVPDCAHCSLKKGVNLSQAYFSSSPSLLTTSTWKNANMVGCELWTHDRNSLCRAHTGCFPSSLQPKGTFSAAPLVPMWGLPKQNWKVLPILETAGMYFVSQLFIWTSTRSWDFQDWQALYSYRPRTWQILGTTCWLSPQRRKDSPTWFIVAKDSQFIGC